MTPNQRVTLDMSAYINALTFRGDWIVLMRLFSVPFIIWYQNDSFMFGSVASEQLKMD